MKTDIYLPGFLFDMDGVLVDTGQLHYQSWLQLQEERSDLKVTYEAFEKGFGKTNETILQEWLPKTSASQRKAIGERKEQLFRQLAKGKVDLLPGMQHFLDQVADKSHPRIIASSTPIANLEFYLSETVLGRYFSRFVSAEEVKQGKPSPDIFIEAAARLNLKPSACVVLEDSHAGLKAGKDAGCFVVALATTHPEENLQDYHLIFSNPQTLDLNAIIEKWRSFAHAPL